jgi:hypothetical protein
MPAETGTGGMTLAGLLGSYLPDMRGHGTLKTFKESVLYEIMRRSSSGG